MNPEVRFDGPSVWQRCDDEKQQLERALLSDARWPGPRPLMDAG